MKRTLEIVYSRSLKLNKGNYQQDSPMWSEKVILEVPDGADLPGIEKIEYEAMKARLDERAMTEWNRDKLDGFRIREKDGKKYVSVTTFLKPEPYNGDHEYGIRGTEIHRLTDIFIETGKWEEPKEVLTKLKYEDLKHKEFFTQYGARIENIKNDLKNVVVYNDDYLFSGEIDRILKVDKKPGLVDYKTGSWAWPQLVCYWKSLPETWQKKIDDLYIFDFKKCELSHLLVDSQSFKDYWEEAVYKRGVFSGAFGI